MFLLGAQAWRTQIPPCHLKGISLIGGILFMDLTWVVSFLYAFILFPVLSSLPPSLPPALLALGLLLVAQ